MTCDRAPSDVPPPDGVRTTRRRGRTSAAKVAALRTLGPRWSLPASGPWTSDALAAPFGRHGRWLIDVGVGNGAATIAWARDQPDANVIAIELHRPGIAKLLADLDAEGPANVRVTEADALAVLDQLPDRSIAEIRVLFPDPWPKRRHVSRRMVDRAFVQLVATVLEVGGLLHLATDSADYADHMRTMVATCPALVADHPAERPDRPVTAYEQRGLDAGRTITDLRYRVTSPST